MQAGGIINARVEIVMLLGEYRQSISSSGRFELPEQVLAGIEGGLVIARGFDQNLILFPAAEWRKLAQSLLGKPISDHNVRTLRRRLFSAAEIVIPDENGRITLPQALRSFAGINGEVILSGMYNHVELWSAERWLPERALIESEDPGGLWDGIDI
jgi:MraZ protein